MFFFSSACLFPASSLPLQSLWSEPHVQCSHPHFESARLCPWSGKGMSLWCTSWEPWAVTVLEQCVLCTQWTISGLQIQFSPAAFHLLSWKYIIFIWGQNAAVLWLPSSLAPVYYGMWQLKAFLLAVGNSLSYCETSYLGKWCFRSSIDPVLKTNFNRSEASNTLVSTVTMAAQSDCLPD